MREKDGAPVKAISNFKGWIPRKFALTLFTNGLQNPEQVQSGSLLLSRWGGDCATGSYDPSRAPGSRSAHVTLTEHQDHRRTGDDPTANEADSLGLSPGISSFKGSLGGPSVQPRWRTTELEAAMLTRCPGHQESSCHYVWARHLGVSDVGSC